MVQRNHRLQAALVQGSQHLAVAGCGGLIPLALSRLQAAPGNRKPVTILPQGRGPVEILFGAVPPIASHIGARATGYAARLLLPMPPIIVRIVPLHLMRRCSRAPQKAIGKAQSFGDRFRHDDFLTKNPDLKKDQT